MSNYYLAVNKYKKMKKMSQDYDLSMVNYPSASGGKIVKLANEMAFASFDLELVEQRLLYYAMSVFDLTSFLGDHDVYRALTSAGKHPVDLSLMSSKLINRYFWSPELRAIRIPLSELMKKASGTGKDGKGNWKWFDKAIASLCAKSIFIRERTDEAGKKRTYNRIPVLGETYYLEDGEQKEVVITFAQEFLPYLIAFHSYKKIDISWLAKLESKYSPRFLHFFIYAADQSGKGEFTITVDNLRERLEIAPEMFKRGFYEKVVKRATDEIMEKIPSISVATEVLRDEKARGRPTTGYKFKVKLKEDKSLLPETKPKPKVMPALPTSFDNGDSGYNDLYDPEIPF